MTTRADTLDEGTLAAFDATSLPLALSFCPGCGVFMLSLGDVARHKTLNEAGEFICPRAALATEGLRYQDDVEFRLKRDGHDCLRVVRVHRLGRNGEPWMWLNGARHSPRCGCGEEWE